MMTEHKDNFENQEAVTGSGAAQIQEVLNEYKAE